MDNLKFRNLTPHPVTLIFGDGQINWPPEVAAVDLPRVTEIVTPASPMGGFPVIRKRYGEVENLPGPEEGVILIVSTLVLQAARERLDLVAPDTGPDSAVRDEDGKIVGIRRFQIV